MNLSVVVSPAFEFATNAIDAAVGTVETLTKPKYPRYVKMHDTNRHHKRAVAAILRRHRKSITRNMSLFQLQLLVDSAYRG